MSHHSQPNPFGFSEANTCREYVTPAIQADGWNVRPHEIAEQPYFIGRHFVLIDQYCLRGNL